MSVYVMLQGDDDDDEKIDVIQNHNKRKSKGKQKIMNVPSENSSNISIMCGCGFLYR